MDAGPGRRRMHFTCHVRTSTNNRLVWAGAFTYEDGKVFRHLATSFSSSSSPLLALPERKRGTRTSLVQGGYRLSLICHHVPQGFFTRGSEHRFIRYTVADTGRPSRYKIQACTPYTTCWSMYYSFNSWYIHSSKLSL